MEEKFLFCYNCNNPMSEGDTFCEKCGADQRNANANSNVATTFAEIQPEGVGVAELPRKKKSKAPIIVIVAVILIAAVAFALFTFLKPEKYNLSQSFENTFVEIENEFMAYKDSLPALAFFNDVESQAYGAYITASGNSISVESDCKNNNYKLQISAEGIELPIYIANDRFVLTAGENYGVTYDDFATNFYSSSLFQNILTAASSLYTTMPDMSDLNLKEYYEYGMAFNKSIVNIFSDSFDKMYETLEIVTSTNKKITINSSDVKCNLHKINLKSEDIKVFTDELLSLISQNDDVVSYINKYYLADLGITFEDMLPQFKVLLKLLVDSYEEECEGKFDLNIYTYNDRLARIHLDLKELDDSGIIVDFNTDEKITENISISLLDGDMSSTISLSTTFEDNVFKYSVCADEEEIELTYDTESSIVSLSVDDSEVFSFSLEIQDDKLEIISDALGEGKIYFTKNQLPENWFDIPTDFNNILDLDLEELIDAYYQLVY